MDEQTLEYDRSSSDAGKADTIVWTSGAGRRSLGGSVAAISFVVRVIGTSNPSWTASLS